MRVLIPLRNKYIFNLFCYSKILNKEKLIKKGTLFRVDGKCVLMYFYGDKRCGYLIRPLLPGEQEEHVPNVYEPCRILCEIEGRLLDEWKFLLYRLEKKYGKSVYEKDDNFWLSTNTMIQERIKIRPRLLNNKTSKKEVRHERTIKRKKRRIKRISRSR